ncbi:Serine/threonine-protein kinase Aurora-3 [Diplonema papillatum]|nr:Serine/threonine-protein kinase Aurora-3 [Diplonema papillatum]
MEDITNKLADMHLDSKAKKDAKSAGDEKPRKHWKLEDFEVGPKMGEGLFGKVYVARVKKMKLVYAMKVLELRKIQPDQLEKELIIHRELRHPHIVRLVTWFIDKAQAYIIIEWCNNGTVYNKMVSSGSRGFPAETAAKYTAQLAEAVQYLHSLTPPILHRDIKPENAFLDMNDNLKLGDFGCSAFMKNAKPRRTIVGTPDYLAPELCSKKCYGKALDAWTIGVFCFEMCYGRPPFEAPQGTGHAELSRRIRSCKLEFPSTPEVDPEARKLISSLLQKDPEKRISVEEVLSHPWIVKNYYERRTEMP